jgi:transposase
MLQLLDEPCVIVMDNAPYHSVLVENVPKSNTKKSDVQKWLSEKGIDFSPTETLVELREKVKMAKPREKRYQLDELAYQMGHEVIRLPPYSCQYNPIELIWAQVKGEVATKNTTFKIADVEKLMHEAIDAVTTENWEKCVRHAEQLQNKDFEKKGFRDCILEPIILTIDPNDSDCSSSKDEDYL